MARFFLHRSQDQTHFDPDGTELPDLAAAIAEAVLSARGIMADEMRHGPLTLGRHFDIVGADGHILATVAFDDCLYRTP